MIGESARFIKIAVLECANLPSQDNPTECQTSQVYNIETDQINFIISLINIPNMVVGKVNHKVSDKIPEANSPNEEWNTMCATEMFY